MKKNIRDEQKGLIFILAILVVVIGLVVVFSFNLKTNAVKKAVEENEIVQNLFIVEDDEGGILFSNLVSSHPKSYKIALLNIPGYTGAIYTSIGRTDKIAAVYKEKGIEPYKQEVEKMLGISHIPFYTIIKKDDFTKLCDYLGGLRVFISEPIDCVSPEGERWLLPSGAVTLDGDKIDTYLSYRTDGEEELDVQERYQNCMAAFISGIYNKKFEIFNENNFKVYSDCITSNLTDEEEKTLFQLIAEADVESLIKQTITGSIRYVDNQELLFPDNNGEFIKEAVRQTTNMLTTADGNLSNRVYVLEIQNGTNINRLAQKTADMYRNASYEVQNIINADSSDYEKTVIIDHIGNSVAASLVGEFIRCDNIREITPEEAQEDFSAGVNVDFTIILGYDFDPLQGHVVAK